MSCFYCTSDCVVFARARVSVGGKSTLKPSCFFSLALTNTDPSQSLASFSSTNKSKNSSDPFINVQGKGRVRFQLLLAFLSSKSSKVVLAHVRARKSWLMILTKLIVFKKLAGGRRRSKWFERFKFYCLF